MKRLRGLWLRVHRWLALSAGWVLILAGLTGAALVVAPPLDRWANPELFQTRSGVATAEPPASLESVLRSVRREFGPGANLVFRPVREPGETLQVRVRGHWRGTLFLDPATGAEQGRRGETEGYANVLFKLHSSLYLEGAGKAILAWVALAYLFLLATGLILWWPRHWSKGWNIVLDKGAPRALFDLHRVGGAAFGLLIAVSVATGAFMAWRPLGAAVTWLAGEAAVKAPELPAASAAGGDTQALDLLAAKAAAQFREPGFIGYIVVPPDASAPIRFRFRLSDDPHPNGLSSVWLDPRTADVLAVQRWNALDPGAKATAVIFPLHTGELGGAALESAVAAGGLALGGLGISGVWLWWRRRSARQSAVRRSSPAPT
ncbi:PepSY-associated TM helix domain-containing protein [Achromobacter sp. NPDC058515]|uniref:PepSY-associated TM helix domain-containing protein n=1 Tax=Achromobacter sp. NPDC058515 TaxID=3346533 RepID=UPI00365F6CDF